MRGQGRLFTVLAVAALPAVAVALAAAPPAGPSTTAPSPAMPSANVAIVIPPTDADLRAAKIRELQDGRAVRTRVYFDRECAPRDSHNAQRIVINDGKLGRLAKEISLRISYPGSSVPAKSLSCTGGNLCTNQDSYDGACRSACVEGSWQTEDGKTVTIPRACEAD